MILLQLSAAQGPAECCLAVALALQQLQREAVACLVDISLIEQEPGPLPRTLRSALLGLDGAAAQTLARRWSGTLLWTSASPFRPGHGRKNWYLGGTCFEPPRESLAGEIRFEAMRSSGAGGQHVNKTDSAVRAIHVASGISVKVQSERSQHANKRLAILLIARKLEQQSEQTRHVLRAERRMAHHRLERGSPSRRFSGPQFEES